jgi:hypothetical protein
MRTDKETCFGTLLRSSVLLQATANILRTWGFDVWKQALHVTQDERFWLLLYNMQANKGRASLALHSQRS